MTYDIMVDLFATRHNHQLPSYISPVPDKEAWAVGALSTSWEGMIAYAFLPKAIIAKVLQKIQTHLCKVMLVAPY